MKTIALSTEKTKSMLLTLLAAAATIIAQTASMSCTIWSFEQTKIPASLIKEDE